jgi:hypothetical protein
VLQPLLVFVLLLVPQLVVHLLLATWRVVVLQRMVHPLLAT